MKKNHIIALTITSLFVLSGCSTDAPALQNTNSQNSEKQEENQQTAQNQESAFGENFTEGSLDDLAVGQKIMVTGITNDDGSIVANMIMIGNDDTNFDEMGRGPQINMDQDSGSQNTRVSQQERPSFPDGQMPDFQNMTEEQKTQMRERMANGRPAADSRSNTSSMSRITGEILKKDSESLIVKLADGGSKFIFISEQTKIIKIKQ